MIRLEESEALQRKIRQDDAAELTISTWTLAREAMRSGRLDEALDFMEYGCAESKTMHDSLVSMYDDAITYLARFDEEELPQLFRQTFYSKTKVRLSVTPGVEEALQRCAESQRSHFSDFTIVEEPDRYVLTCDLCGSGGRLRRTKDVATTKKAYPWSWSKSGIPYYCTHCCLMWEIIPTELRGYPIRINLITERPEDPCVQLYYKKPELIPEEYFTRIGMTKTIK
ncbi:hypothetical protein ACFLV4_02590 [Chloroflexota bacterium]